MLSTKHADRRFEAKKGCKAATQLALAMEKELTEAEAALEECKVSCKDEVEELRRALSVERQENAKLQTALDAALCDLANLKADGSAADSIPGSGSCKASPSGCHSDDKNIDIVPIDESDAYKPMPFQPSNMQQQGNGQANSVSPALEKIRVNNLTNEHTASADGIESNRLNYERNFRDSGDWSSFVAQDRKVYGAAQYDTDKDAEVFQLSEELAKLRRELDSVNKQRKLLQRKVHDNTVTAEKLEIISHEAKIWKDKARLLANRLKYMLAGAMRATADSEVLRVNNAMATNERKNATARGDTECLSADVRASKRSYMDSNCAEQRMAKIPDKNAEEDLAQLAALEVCTIRSASGAVETDGDNTKALYAELRQQRVEIKRLTEALSSREPCSCLRWSGRNLVHRRLRSIDDRVCRQSFTISIVSGSGLVRALRLGDATALEITKEGIRLVGCSAPAFDSWEWGAVRSVGRDGSIVGVDVRPVAGPGGVFYLLLGDNDVDCCFNSLQQHIRGKINTGSRCREARLKVYD